MEKRILVPLDGSNTAEMVLPYATEIAARTRSEVIITSVHELETHDVDRLFSTYLNKIAEEVRASLSKYGALEPKIWTRLLEGKAANEIVQCADEEKVGLIALASRGASGEGPWLLGSIAAKVLRATDKPVLLIRTPASEKAIEERRLLKKILVPLDGSEWGEAAVPMVLEFSGLLQCEVTLFQAIRPVSPWAGDAPLVIPQDIEHRRSSSAAYLLNVEKRFKDKAINVNSVVVTGVPADTIIDYAKTNSIDLIAMSTHGRSGVDRWVFGSITDKVLHAGDTAVLTVRPPARPAR